MANKFNTLAASSPRCLSQSNLDGRIATYHHAQSAQEIPTTKGSSSSQYSHTETRSQRLRSCQIEEPPLPKRPPSFTVEAIRRCHEQPALGRTTLFNSDPVRFYPIFNQIPKNGFLKPASITFWTGTITGRGDGATEDCGGTRSMKINL